MVEFTPGGISVRRFDLQEPGSVANIGTNKVAARTLGAEGKPGMPTVGSKQPMADAGPSTRDGVDGESLPDTYSQQHGGERCRT